MEKVKSALLQLRLGPWEALPFHNDWKNHYEQTFTPWIELDEHVSAWVWEKAMVPLEEAAQISVLVEDVKEGAASALSGLLLRQLRSWVEKEKLQAVWLPQRFYGQPWLRAFPEAMLHFYAEAAEIKVFFVSKG